MSDLRSGAADDATTSATPIEQLPDLPVQRETPHEQPVSHDQADDVDEPASDAGAEMQFTLPHDVASGVGAPATDEQAVFYLPSGDTDLDAPVAAADGACVFALPDAPVAAADETDVEPADDYRDQTHPHTDGQSETPAHLIAEQEVTEPDTTERHDAADRPEPPTDQPAVWRADQLRPTGQVDTTYGEPLLIDDDGKKHFAGDPLDTQRSDAGSLHGPEGRFIRDANPRPTADLQRRAEHDLDTRRTHEPQPAAGPADDAVIEARDHRQELVDQRDAIWSALEPISDKLRPHDITLDRSTTRHADADIVTEADPYLTPREARVLNENISELIRLNKEIKNASENLGTAGGALTTHREFPTATTISGGDSQPGTAGNFDRVIMIDDRAKAVIIMEEKGVGSTLGSRLAPDPLSPAQSHIRVEQGSTEYLRHLLQTDNKLAKALASDPGLAQRMDQILRGPNPGQLRYLLVRTSKEGIVTVTDFKIDPQVLGLGDLRLSGKER